MALSKIQSESIDLADNFAGMRFGGTASDNALNDFEEGTHTTSIGTSSSGSVTLVSSLEKLTYVKIGSLVHVQGAVSTNTISSPSGYFTVSVPFVVGNYDQLGGRLAGSVVVVGSSANVRDFACIAIEGENHFRVYLGDNPNLQSDSANALGTNDDIYVSFQYRTTA